MRRIILVFSLLALTSCAGEPAADRAEPSTDAAPGVAASSSPATSADHATSADPASSEDTVRPAAPAGPRGTVIFVGTSLTAGYGIGEELAYPAVIQAKIDSAGLPFEVRNAGISGETSAAGLRRIDWTLQRRTEVLVLELGANDGLRGLPVADMRSNLDEILRRARAAHPDIALVVLGMEAPPNLGNAYTSGFRQVYAELAQEYGAALVPFLLEGVAAEPSLNIADGIHPNVEGHRIMAATVWDVLEPVLRRRAAQSPTAAGRVPSSDAS